MHCARIIIILFLWHKLFHTVSTALKATFPIQIKTFACFRSVESYPLKSYIPTEERACNEKGVEKETTHKQYLEWEQQKKINNNKKKCIEKCREIRTVQQNIERCAGEHEKNTRYTMCWRFDCVWTPTQIMRLHSATLLQHSAPPCAIYIVESRLIIIIDGVLPLFSETVFFFGSLSHSLSIKLVHRKKHNKIENKKPFGRFHFMFPFVPDFIASYFYCQLNIFRRSITAANG